MTKNQELVMRAVKYTEIFARVSKQTFDVHAKMIRICFYRTMESTIYTTDRAFQNKNGRDFLFKKNEELVSLLTDAECEDAIRQIHLFVMSHKY